MKIKVTYSKIQFDAAVDFLGKHNIFFKNNFEAINISLLNSIQELARNHELWTLSTMGYRLISSIQYEDIDNDETIISIEIYVDPAVSKPDLYLDNDNMVIDMDVPASEFYSKIKS